MTQKPNAILLDDDGGVDGKQFHGPLCFCRTCREYGCTVVNSRYSDTPEGKQKKIQDLRHHILFILPKKLENIVGRVLTAEELLDASKEVALYGKLLKDALCAKHMYHFFRYLFDTLILGRVLSLFLLCHIQF